MFLDQKKRHQGNHALNHASVCMKDRVRNDILVWSVKYIYYMKLKKIK